MKAHDPRSHDDWALLRQFLPRDAEQIAYRHGFNPRPPKHLRAKLTDFSGLLRLLLIHTGLDLSLVNTAALAPSLGLPEISDVALLKRLNKAPAWMAPLLAELINENNRFSPARWAGYQVVAIDGTHLAQDGAPGVSHRILYSLDLATGQPLDVQVTDVSQGETLRYARALPGQLYIGDRAYCTSVGIHHLHRQKAHLLTRYNPHTAPLLDARGQPFDVLKKLGQVAAAKVREFKVQVTWRDHHSKDRDAPLGARLIIKNLGSKVRAQALKRLRLQHDNKVPRVARATAGYLILLTTVPQDRLSARALLRLYRMRWSVELKIKVDKSLWKISHMPTKAPHSGIARILGKLILEQLWNRILLSCAPSKKIVC